MGFWHLLLGIYGGGEVVTSPNDGWIASSSVRIAVGTSRERVSIPVSRDRVWIAKDKVQE